MIGFLKNELDKMVYVSLGMEQLFWDMKDLQDSTNYMAKCFQVESFIMHDWDDYVNKYNDYTWVLDFSHIGGMARNSLAHIANLMSNIKKKTICCCDGLDKKTRTELVNNGFEEEDKESFSDAFECYIIKHLMRECLIEKIEYSTGETITGFISLLGTIENNTLFFQMCYLLAEKLYDDFGGDIDNHLLFCHTLSGANIAEMLSMILGLDVFYTDRLTSLGRLRRNFMPREVMRENKCIVVTDVVCQGHELIRAKDVVAMLGGYYAGCVGVVRIEINNIEDDKDTFLITIDHELQREIGYKVYIGRNEYE